MNRNFHAWEGSMNAQKQSGTRPFRIPALLGALFCAVGLLVSPGKSFSQLPPRIVSATDIEGQGSSHTSDHRNNFFTEFGNNKAKPS
jgi:hypothetical protein